MLERIQAAAEQLNWEVLEVRMYGFEGVRRVLVFRADAPFKGQEYSLHVYNDHTGGFESGRYDRSLEGAMRELDEMAAKA